MPFKHPHSLAEGKLDGYINSINRSDKIAIPNVILSSLLLHDLGKRTEVNRIQLFLHLLFYGQNQLFTGWSLPRLILLLPK